MKTQKDWFNGYIKNEYIGMTKFSLILGALVMGGCGIIFLCIGLTYDKVEKAARIALCVLSGLAFLFAIGYPSLSIWAIRHYPKHKRLAHLCIKKDCFVDEE